MPKTTDRTLMERLREAYEQEDQRGVNRAIAAIEKRVRDALDINTRSYPDPETARNAALYEMTKPTGVERWLTGWSASLATYAKVIARSTEARDAALLTERIMNRDALYATRSTSLDALVEEHGDRLASARTLAELEAERRREVRVIREGFTRSATGTLTEKQTAAVIRYANLHDDGALPEMATQEAAARALRIKRRALRDRLDAVTKKVENDAALRESIGLLVDDVERVEREALESQLARARAAMGAAA